MTAIGKIKAETDRTANENGENPCSFAIIPARVYYSWLKYHRSVGFDRSASQNGDGWLRHINFHYASLAAFDLLCRRPYTLR